MPRGKVAKHNKLDYQIQTITAVEGVEGKWHIVFVSGNKTTVKAENILAKPDSKIPTEGYYLIPCKLECRRTLENCTSIFARLEKCNYNRWYLRKSFIVRRQYS